MCDLSYQILKSLMWKNEKKKILKKEITLIEGEGAFKEICRIRNSF